MGKHYVRKRDGSTTIIDGNRIVGNVGGPGVDAPTPNTPHANGNNSPTEQEGPSVQQAWQAYESRHDTTIPADETDLAKAKRLGREFATKRDSGEPIEGIGELTAMEFRDAEDFIYQHENALGLEWNEDFHESKALAEAVMLAQSNDRRLDLYYDETSEQERATLEQVMGAYATDGTVIVAMPQHAVIDLLAGDGHAKSQFETDTSGGMFNRYKRAVHESATHRIHPGTPAHLRHTHGYVTLHPDDGGVGTATVDQYGAVRIQLKPSVHARTSITAGDSLSSPARPIPMGVAPSRRAAYDAAQGWGGEYFADHDTANAEHLHYVEAQIGGGWDLSDVAVIHLPRHVADPQTRQQFTVLASLADEHGIEYAYYD